MSFNYKAVFTQRNDNISFKSAWIKVNKGNETNDCQSGLFVDIIMQQLSIMQLLLPLF